MTSINVDYINFKNKKDLYNKTIIIYIIYVIF